MRRNLASTDGLGGVVVGVAPEAGGELVVGERAGPIVTYRIASAIMRNSSHSFRS